MLFQNGVCGSMERSTTSTGATRRSTNRLSWSGQPVWPSKSWRRPTISTLIAEVRRQQIAIGNQNQPLMEQWAICGACGHMRLVEHIQQPGASPACPQCHHDSDSQSQLDQGQYRQFIEFARSQAVSFMEHYDSMSGDRDEERQRGFYQVIRSFRHDGRRPSRCGGR